MVLLALPSPPAPDCGRGRGGRRGRGSDPRAGAAHAARPAPDPARPPSRLSIALASAAAAAGHPLVFLVAARTAGVDASADAAAAGGARRAPRVGDPTSIAGWGPREGAAAWAFGAVGLTAAQGVTTAVVYGVMALVATLPGALVLIAGRRRQLEAAHG